MFKKALLLILMQILICTLVYAGGIVPPRQDPDNPEWKPGEILVKFKDNVELQISSNRGILETGINSLNELNNKWQISEMEKVFRTEEKRKKTKTIMTYTGEIIDVPQLFNIYKMKFNEETDVLEVVEDFEINPNVEYAEPNYIAQICVIPDDPDYSQQWGLPAIHAPEAWEIETGDSTSIICVIDTGVEWDHPDLLDKIWINEIELNGIPGIDDDNNGYIDDIKGWNYIWNNNDPYDDNGHGTHVSGIAAASTNNGIGIAGTNWSSKIMIVKALSHTGTGSYGDLAQGVNYAANNNAAVINLSLGGYANSYILQMAIENAYTNCVIVASAGNDGISVEEYPLFPAAYSFVIGVQSPFPYGGYWSNFDPNGPATTENGYNYEVIAPGASIYSTMIGHSYASWSGTSMAAPFVSGTLALLRSYFPDWSNELLIGQLIQSSEGVINAYAALTLTPEPVLASQEYTVIDTLPGCDQDGIADAGETIEMVFTVKNFWAQADTVEMILRLERPWHDSTYVTIIDSISTFGNISAYATNNNEDNPFVLDISSTTPNNSNILMEYSIICANSDSVWSDTFWLTTQRGTNISGIISEDTTLSNDYLYIVNGNMLVNPGITLTIEPGTRIQFDADKYLRIDGCLLAIGIEDSMIVFTSNCQTHTPGDWASINFTDPSEDAVFDSAGNYVSGSIIKYAEIELGEGIKIDTSSPYIVYNYIHDNRYSISGSIRIQSNSYIEPRIEHNLIQGNLACTSNGIPWGHGGGITLGACGYRLEGAPYIAYNVIEGNVADVGGGINVNGIDASSCCPIITNNIIRGNSANVGSGIYVMYANALITNNNIYGNYKDNSYDPGDLLGSIFVNGPSQFRNNNIINNQDGFAVKALTIIDSNNILCNHQGENYYDIHMYNSGQNINASHNYWGTTNTDSIDTWIWDYYDDFGLGLVTYDPFADSPIVDAPGFLYQVEFNPPPPIGCEVDTLNLIFSKPMDISIQPYVTFGVCDPYTQHIIEGAWVDSTNWQGTYAFNLMTGDGINNLRVTTAEDCEGMEIPKDTRFSFIIDATGASSVGFIAQAGFGQVDLEWHGQDMVDLMGYNMYRYYEVTDSTYSDITLINTSMITDTTYCDMSVNPGITYYYMYTGISTDFVESDYSDPASATTFTFFTDFEANPTMGYAPLEVQFTDLSTPSDSIISWHWDLDYDGVVDSYEQNPLFTYLETGLFTVSLTVSFIVSDSLNTDTEIKEDYITVGESLVANFEATPTAGLYPLEVQFTDLSSGGLPISVRESPDLNNAKNEKNDKVIDNVFRVSNANKSKNVSDQEKNSERANLRDIAFWEWDFENDGVVDSYEQNPVWLYDEAGLYSVSLTIYDADGNSATEMKDDYITVLADDIPVIVIPDTLDFTDDWWGSKPLTVSNISNDVVAITGASELESPFSFDFEYFQEPIYLEPQGSVNLYVSCDLDTLEDFSDDLYLYYSSGREPDSVKVVVKEDKPQDVQIHQMCATIVDIKGIVQYKLKGEDDWHDAEEGFVWEVGTTLFTDIDSSVKLCFGSCDSDKCNSYVTIGELSCTKIDKYYKRESVVTTRLKVKQGLIDVKVTETGKEIKTDQKIKTPNWSASVTGTVFSVDYDSLTATSIIEAFDDTVKVTRKFHELDTLLVVGDGHGLGQRLTITEDGDYYYEDLEDLGIRGNVSGIWDPFDWHIVTDNITIPAGDTLVILPGVDVEFNTADSISGDFNMSDGDTEARFLTVNGTLIAEGTRNRPISFTRFGQSGEWDDSYKWGNIYFSPLSGTGSVLSYVKITGANHIDNISGYDAGGAISFNESSAAISYSEISSNFDNGIFCRNGSNPILTNLSITGNDGYGLNCGSYSSPLITNTIIWGNLGDISVTDEDSPSLSYSLVEGSFLPDQVEDVGGNLIGFDPLFCDPDSSNYNLTGNSPCIDTGDPGSPIDPDSTIADMGAYYYDQNVIIYPPEADFISDVTDGYLPLTVQFEDLSIPGTDAIIVWEWDFENDGIIDSDEQYPLFTYLEAGLFTVSLTVCDGVNPDTEIKEDYITVGEPLVANFAATPTTGMYPLEVQFTDLSSGGLPILLRESPAFNNAKNEMNDKVLDSVFRVSNADKSKKVSDQGKNSERANLRDIASWEWDFENDGVIDSNEQNPIWLYEEAGLYSVSLTIYDAEGNSATEMKDDYITVQDPLIFPRPWEVVIYTNSTTAYCEVLIDGLPASEEDEVGAFVGEECRGVGCVSNSGDESLATFSIQGGIIETINFAVYDFSEDMVCSVSYETQTNPGGEIGSPPNFLPIYAVSAPNQPIVADFSADPVSGIVPLPVEFTDLSTSQDSIISWAWDFENDGTIDSYEQNPVWVYDEQGVYSVSLTVSTDIGRDTSTEIKEDYITVRGSQEISLNAGWNLFSVNVELEDDNVESIFSEQIAAGDLMQVKDTKLTEVPQIPEYFNTLTNFADGDGYWVNLAEADTIEINGVNLDPATTLISLNGGWNLIAFIPESSMNVEIAFADLIDLGYLIKVKSITESYDPNLEPQFNTLNTVTPGMAYWVKVSIDVDFYYPSPGSRVTRANITRITNRDNEIWEPIIYTNSTTLFGEVTLNGIPAESGDMVAAFVNGECRGCQEVVLHEGNAYLSLLINGQESEIVNFQIWDSSEDEIYDVEYTTTSNPGGFIGYPPDIIQFNAIIPFVSDFIANPLSGNAPLEVQFTDLSTGNPIIWAWDFENDGVIDSYEQNPVWIYDEQGMYSVSLTVSDGVSRDTSTELKVGYIEVEEMPIFPRPWEVVYYTNSTVAYCEVTIDGEPAATGDEVGAFVGEECRGVGYVSNNGDESEACLNIQGEVIETIHFAVYDVSEDMVCSVSYTTQTNPGGDIGYQNLLPIFALSAPNLPLSADFSADPTSGMAPLTVEFNDNSTGNPIIWAWDFDYDGIIDSYEQNPVWVYDELGVYSVSLTVSDGVSRTISTELKVYYITVEEVQIFPRPWEVVYYYTNATVAYCEVTIDGSPASSEDEVGAFVGGECRGIGEVVINASQSICTINIKGEIIETVQFAVYDVSEDLVCSVSYTTQTNPGGDIGYPPDLLPIAAFSPFVANFIAEPTSGMAPLTVEFTPVATGNLIYWEWDFEYDGVIDSYESNPVWVYNEPGVYSVSLTVTDDQSHTDTVINEYCIIVTPNINAPTINLPDSFSFYEDEYLNVEFEEYLYDSSGDSLSLAVTGNVEINVTITGTEVFFSASENWYGSEELTFIVYDDQERLSDTDDVIVIVNPVNDTPVIALPEVFYLNGSGELSIELADYAYDIDNDILLFTAITGDELDVEISGSIANISSDISWMGSENLIFIVDDQQGRLTACDTVLVVKELYPYPIIESIIDVPDDQGGWVFVEFTGSCFDDDYLITRPSEQYQVEYLVEDNWIAAGSTIAYGAETYQVLVHTLQDSMPEFPNTYEFRVIAGMEEGNFVSNTMTGYSLDNICPQVPTELLFDAGCIVWSAPVDEDFAYFSIYRDGELLDYSTEPELNIIGESGEYQVAAVDCHANESELSITISGGYPYGDIDHNIEVEAMDASLVLQYFCLIITDWEEWQITVGDVDGNGSVEAYDASLILRFTVGLINEFPVEQVVRK